MTDRVKLRQLGIDLSRYRGLINKNSDFLRNYMPNLALVIGKDFYLGNGSRGEILLSDNRNPEDYSYLEGLDKSLVALGSPNIQIEATGRGLENIQGNLQLYRSIRGQNPNVKWHPGDYRTEDFTPKDEAELIKQINSGLERAA